MLSCNLPRACVFLVASDCSGFSVSEVLTSFVMGQRAYAGDLDLIGRLYLCQPGTSLATRYGVNDVGQEGATVHPWYSTCLVADVAYVLVHPCDGGTHGCPDGSTCAKIGRASCRERV